LPNYSSGFNAEATHLVWSGLTLPTYSRKKIKFEDVHTAITRIPERGKYVKGLTLQFVSFAFDISNEALNSLAYALGSIHVHICFAGNFEEFNHRGVTHPNLGVPCSAQTSTENRVF